MVILLLFGFFIMAYFGSGVYVISHIIQNDLDESQYEYDNMILGLLVIVWPILLAGYAVKNIRKK